MRRGRAQRYCSVRCRASYGPYSSRKNAPESCRPRVKSPAVLERRAKAIALRAAGLTLKAIGEQLGVTKERVRMLLVSVPHPMPS